MSDPAFTLPPGAEVGQMKVDVVDSTTTYVGFAGRGVAEGTTSWFVREITVSGTVTSIKTASIDFSVDWTNRATHTYL